MARTPESRRVRTEYLQGSLDAATTVITQDTLIDSFTPQIDIRVIGWHFEMELQQPPLQLNDLDQCRVAAFLSRGAAQDLDNRWAVLHALAQVTVRAGGDDYDGGDGKFAVNDVIFPEGYGFDVDEGESVYLYATNRNDTGLTMTVNGTCVLYYIVR